jgi:two-component system, OmpR family, response regulator CpxR
MEKILIIDDDRELCELVREYLATEGLRAEAVHNGRDGAARALSGDFDLVVLDVMLPILNGTQVLQKIRATSRIPVVMLTARGEDVDRIVGLELGADDYLPKPFNPRELAARIRAVLRRTRQPQTPGALPLIRVGDIELDAGARRATRKGTALPLTTLEFDLLQVLLESAGSVVNRNEIARRVLGRDFDPLDRSIDVHVSNLRRKLGAPEKIKSVRGVGYQYAVHAAEAATARTR